MFGFNAIEVSNLKVRIEELEKENEKLSYANTVYKARLETEMATAPFAINWSIMNAFSIERQWENGSHRTIIGYMLQEPVVVTEGAVTTKDVVREWTLYCSATEHERLVNEFNEFNKGKKK